ncbi:hypothetical protein StoSoilB20_37280 [Arthrobacter sp. StoSoilB20]|nr:hypothetical protein StoSoilB20_37280 [Arthrobacter sp. StoSoilB20]
MSAAALALLLAALGEAEVGAAEVAAGGGVEVAVVPGLPPHPAIAAARITAPNPKLSRFFISRSFDEPAGTDRR